MLSPASASSFSRTVAITYELACSRSLFWFALRSRHEPADHSGVNQGCGAVGGQKKAGEQFPGVSEETRTNYRLILRRTIAVPTRIKLLASGTFPSSVAT
jgi:hypothetical protein